MKKIAPEEQWSRQGVSMETRSMRKAGLQLAPPEGVLTDPTSLSPTDPEEDLGLAAMMGDREVPLVGGD